MNDTQALLAIVLAFPGTIPMPRLVANPSGRSETCAYRNCFVWTALPDGKKAIHGTMLIDDTGRPFHEKCKLHSMGIE